MVTDGMRGAVVGTKAGRVERQSRLVQYFVDTLHMHNVYAAGYFLCEVLNFINVVSKKKIYSSLCKFKQFLQELFVSFNIRHFCKFRAVCKSRKCLSVFRILCKFEKLFSKMFVHFFFFFFFFLSKAAKFLPIFLSFFIPVNFVKYS